jgi:succinyl-CoA synthetase beta subunit
MDVRLCRTAPLPILDISAGGLLVEHPTPFKPGTVCDVELERSGQKIHLRGEVVRSAVTRGGGGKAGGIRYLTAVEFLEPPETILSLLQGLSQES